MEFLFTDYAVGAEAEGYAWFSLGMAPLSGLELPRLAPLWNRLGALLSATASTSTTSAGCASTRRSSSPCGSRAPRVPGGLALPRALSNLATLISGGLTGVVASDRAHSRSAMLTGAPRLRADVPDSLIPVGDLPLTRCRAEGPPPGRAADGDGGLGARRRSRWPPRSSGATWRWLVSAHPDTWRTAARPRKRGGSSRGSSVTFSTRGTGSASLSWVFPGRRHRPVHGLALRPPCEAA